MVGTRRGTGGRGLIRLVMNTDFLVGYRLKPVYSPTVYAAMGQPHDHGTAPGVYESRDAAQQSVDAAKWARTRANHLALSDWPDLMHNADEPCEFCDGRDAARAGAETNPYEPTLGYGEGSVDYWGTDHGLWQCGWLTERHQSNPDRITDLGVRHLAFSRRRMSRSASMLARTGLGRTVADLEADGIGRSRIRFVRGDYRPRLLDGIVHAWLDAEERVVTTRSG